MNRASTAIVLLLLSAAAPLVARGQTQPRAANQPFSAFQSLDKWLSDAQEQYRALEASLQADEKELAHSKAWRKPAKKFRADIRSVERTAHRLRLYYRHSKWGRKAFLALEKKAQRMEREADALVRARAPAAAKQARDALSKEMLPLVVQFQALTTNYSALHCRAGQTACCQPKKRESAEKVPEHECKWVCVESRKSCRDGITGPTSGR